MHVSRAAEIAVGLFVILGMAALLMLGLEVSGISSLGSEGYVVSARFENVGQLKPRAPVTMGGVRIGRVERIDYDEDSYEAIAVLRIDDRFSRIPDDTSASVLTAGLLGERYVGLEPGGSLEFLTDDSQIQYTQSALILEKIIGQFLFGKTGERQSP